VPKIKFITKEKKGVMRDNKTVIIFSKYSRYIADVLKNNGFDITVVDSDESILQKSKNCNVSAIIRDFDNNVHLFARRIKMDYFVSCIPLICVVSKNNKKEIFSFWRHGIDDYIFYPFSDEEILSRIIRLSNLNEKALNANPLTRLPGNITIQREIQKRIEKNMEFAAYYIDINSFKVFNDRYGYERGDRAIKFTAESIWNALKMAGYYYETDFAGHIGGDDFVVLTDRAKIDNFCTGFIDIFDSGIRKFYDKGDLLRGFIIGRNRKGETKFYPIMSVSIAVAVNYGGNLFCHFAQVSERCAELKVFIKKFKKSMYMVDRRNWVPKRQSLLRVAEQVDI